MIDSHRESRCLLRLEHLRESSVCQAAILFVLYRCHCDFVCQIARECCLFCRKWLESITCHASRLILTGYRRSVRLFGHLVWISLEVPFLLHPAIASPEIGFESRLVLLRECDSVVVLRPVHVDFVLLGDFGMAWNIVEDYLDLHDDQ